MNKDFWGAVISLMAVSVSLHAQNSKAKSTLFPIGGKEVSIYTTAQNTNYRLTKQGHWFLQILGNHWKRRCVCL
jgi:hypothetical protein